MRSIFLLGLVLAQGAQFEDASYLPVANSTTPLNQRYFPIVSGSQNTCLTYQQGRLQMAACTTLNQAQLFAYHSDRFHVFANSNLCLTRSETDLVVETCSDKNANTTLSNVLPDGTIRTEDDQCLKLSDQTIVLTSCDLLETDAASFTWLQNYAVPPLSSKTIIGQSPSQAAMKGSKQASKTGKEADTATFLGTAESTLTTQGNTYYSVSANKCLINCYTAVTFDSGLMIDGKDPSVCYDRDLGKVRCSDASTIWSYNNGFVQFGNLCLDDYLRLRLCNPNDIDQMWDNNNVGLGDFYWERITPSLTLSGVNPQLVMGDNDVLFSIDSNGIVRNSLNPYYCLGADATFTVCSQALKWTRYLVSGSQCVQAGNPMTTATCDKSPGQSFFLGPVPITTTTTTTTTAKPTTTTTTTTSDRTTTTKTTTTTTVPKPSPTLGDKKFTGTLKGIGSFFHSNLKSDETNGHSWCNYPYKDYSRGFAPDLKQMTDGTLAKYGHPKWEYYGKISCGDEAIVTNLDNGKSMTMYILDAFDPAWVKSPGSIDIMADAWHELSGGAPFDKSHVLNIQWTLTGKKSDKYCFGCSGDP